jgi:hypothetical protein
VKSLFAGECVESYSSSRSFWRLRAEINVLWRVFDVCSVRD